MRESELIWKFLSREFNDSHPAIYLYVLGNTQQKTKVVNNVIDVCIGIFSCLFDKPLISTVVKAFLEFKLNQYKKGILRFNQ